MKLTSIALMFSLGAFAPATFAQDEAVKKDAPVIPAETGGPNTIAKWVMDGQTFSILEKAVEAAGLTETLKGAGPFTVFAPTDEAFGKLPEGTLSQLLLPENKEKLRSLLLYHVVAGNFPAAKLADAELKTVNGEKIEIDVDGDGVEVEDSKVVNADRVASNGVVHVIDKVMVPKSLDGFADLDED